MQERGVGCFQRGDNDQRNLRNQWFGCTHRAGRGGDGLGPPDSSKLSAEESLQSHQIVVGHPIFGRRTIPLLGPWARQNLNRVLVEISASASEAEELAQRIRIDERP